LQQVSGNEISTQGSLATRVNAGQAGNIAGRLNALRLGSSFALTQGVSARADSPSLATRPWLQQGRGRSTSIDRSRISMAKGKDPRRRPRTVGNFQARVP